MIEGYLISLRSERQYTINLSSTYFPTRQQTHVRMQTGAPTHHAVSLSHTHRFCGVGPIRFIGKLKGPFVEVLYVYSAGKHMHVHLS